MPKTIIQNVLFKNTSAKVLYNLYMDAKKHSEIAGAPVKITSKVGGSYSVHGGYITGKNLSLVKDKVIVQTWRAVDWNKTDIDSIFTLGFEQKGKDTEVHMVHAFVPDKHAASIDKGWHDYYWKPWKQFLAGKPITRAEM